MAQTPDLSPAHWGGDPRRGAAMGRPDKRADAETRSRFSLRRVRLDSGGYDAGGAYWGIGAPLYWAGSDDGAAEMFFRLDPATRRQVVAAEPHDELYRRHHGRLSQWLDRETAKAQVREEYPAARFYR